MSPLSGKSLCLSWVDGEAHTVQLGSRRSAEIPFNVGTLLSRCQRHGVRYPAFANVLVLTRN
jgi:hypothetical protein